MTKRELMKRAHALAKQMEGDYRARLVIALQQAWQEAKGMKKSVIYNVNHQPSGGKEWVAEIVGRHPKFKFERSFLSPIERKWSGSGKTGTTRYELEAGKVYEVNEPWKGRWFITVENGEVVEITAEEVLKKL
jgi:hypothetical protein